VRGALVLAVTIAADALALAIAILVQKLLGIIIVLGTVSFSLYWLYITLHKKRRPRYPMVPPEGKGDVYLPRTNIPRPVYADLRRMQETKLRLEELKKSTRRKRPDT